MTGGWGKAGVRLTDREVEQHRRAAAKRRNQRRAADERDLEAGRRIWERGLIVPRSITFALDAMGAEGPEVDIACGAQEPDVDRWEAAELYPTWEQFVALSRYTGFTLRWFGHDTPDIDGGFICGPRGAGCRRIVPDNLPRRFPREVVDERMKA